MDDDVNITSVLKLGLEHFHEIMVDTYNDPNEALNSFQPGTHNVIILDIKMPGMDGRLLYQEIMKRDAKANICFLTAFDPPEFGGFPSDMKAIRLFRKPISILKLASEIREMARANDRSVARGTTGGHSTPAAAAE